VVKVAWKRCLCTARPGEAGSEPDVENRLEMADIGCDDRRLGEAGSEKEGTRHSVVSRREGGADHEARTMEGVDNEWSRSGGTSGTTDDSTSGITSTSDFSLRRVKGRASMTA
jgi:hypothetical protein